MARKTRRWDAADTLRTKRDIAAYLDAVLEDGDPDLLKAAAARKLIPTPFPQGNAALASGAPLIESWLVARRGHKISIAW